MAKKIKGLIDFTYELSDGSTKTIKLAAPIMPEGEELSHPLEDYFPQKSPALWFEMMSPRQHKDYVKGVIMGGACPIFGHPVLDNGELLDLHHEYRSGAGQRDEAEAPWTMIPGLRSPDPLRSSHDLYHQMTLTNDGFQLVKWDFLDEENGFTVLDEKGEEIARKDLWFYTRPTDERVQFALEWLEGAQKANATLVKAAYDLGIVFSQGDEYAKLLGYWSVGSCFAQHGICSDTPKMMKMLFEERSDAYSVFRDHLVIPEAADLFRKRTKKADVDAQSEWEDKALQMVSPKSKTPSFAAFGQLIRKRFPPEPRMHNITILKGIEDEDYEETENLDPQELANEGKIVIAGHRIAPVEKEEPKTPMEEAAASAGEDEE